MRIISVDKTKDKKENIILTDGNVLMIDDIDVNISDSIKLDGEYKLVK